MTLFILCHTTLAGVLVFGVSCQDMHFTTSLIRFPAEHFRLYPIGYQQWDFSENKSMLLVSLCGHRSTTALSDISAMDYVAACIMAWVVILFVSSIPTLSVSYSKRSAGTTNASQSPCSNPTGLPHDYHCVITPIYCPSWKVTAMRVLNHMPICIECNGGITNRKIQWRVCPCWCVVEYCLCCVQEGDGMLV